MEIKNPQYFGQLLHKEGFERWFLYMFKVIEGRKFIKEGLHPQLFQAYQDVYDLKEKRLNINVCPRSAKTTLAKYFIAYTLAFNPKSNFIYTSYSQALLNDISRDLTNILTHPIYLAMYDNGAKEEKQEIDPIDEFWQSYIREETGKPTFSSRKITTAEGGVVLFSSIGSQLTGFGCFDYDTLVLTENGFLKLGYIVENKLNIKVWTYNFKNQKRELKDIERFVKNESSPFLKIKLDNNEIINATPDHIFYLENGEEIEAKDLKVNFKLFSNVFNSVNWNSIFFKYLFSRIVFIGNKFNLFFTISFVKRFCSNSAPLIPNSLSFSSPKNTRFNIRNIISCSSKILCYFWIWSLIACYLFYLLNSKFSISIMSSMSYAILLIIGLSSINKIFKSIVFRIPVKMPYYQSIRLTNKSQTNKSMNKFANRLISFSTLKCKIIIPLFANCRLKISFSNIRKNFSTFTNKIIFKRGYRKIIDIVDSNHIKPSYCLTIKDHNNFFINNSQVLVHNCGQRGAKIFSGCLIIDDANKPSDIYSQVRREKVKLYFEETLLSRLNDSEVPIINIQQRLHLEDLTGFLLTKYKFNLLKLPLVADGVCQLPSQYTPERLEELQKNEFMFLSQYQQTPIISGGAIFKRDCFIFTNILPEKYDYTFMTADLAYKDKQHNDFTCFSYWGVLDKKLYLIDAKRKKINAVEIDGWIRPWIMPKLGYGFRYIWIEDKAHGTYLLQQYRKDGLPVPSEQMIKQTLPRDGDKVMRANNIIPCLNMTIPNVIFNNQIEGFNDLVEELLSFNNSTNDDFVDTVIDGCKIALFEKRQIVSF
jgi:predicted phage terminase large subunit-like protein